MKDLSAQTNKRILVVDDTSAIHADFRKILAPQSTTPSTLLSLEKKLLNSEAVPNAESQPVYSLNFASQGLEAIELVKQSVDLSKPYAVAFIDVRMPPGIDGIETICEIWKADPRVQAVICTAFSDHGWKEIVGKLSHTDKLLILKKPFDQMELLQITTALTQKWGLERVVEKRFGELEFEAGEYFKQLAHAQKMDAIGRLASGISHDFNNLLTINLGYASLLLSRTDLSEKARFCVNAMNDATERAAGLTRQLLSFSRQQSTVTTVLSPNDVIKKMEPLLARATGENIRFILNLDESDLHIRIDKTQLEQILLNLVINSRDAMNTSGEISITTRQMTHQELPGPGSESNAAQDCFVISVKDNGHGMSDEIKTKIFEPFFTTKDSEHGTGLGLSTVYGIVQKHQGRIWVDSTIGIGTTFHIALPVATDNASAEAGPLVGPTSEEPKCILVVDDELAVRQVTLQILKESGFHVFEAANGAEALKQLANSSRKFDIVLTDIVMPKLTGIQLAETLTNTYPTLPIVFMSGNPKDPKFQEDVENGKKHFLQKPFSNDNLLEILRKALNEAPDPKCHEVLVPK